MSLREAREREKEGNEVLVELLLIGSLSLSLSFVFHDAYRDKREKSVADASSAESVH